MFTGMGVGLAFGAAVFALVMLQGDVLAGIFTTDADVVANAYAYLKGFAPETLATAILFTMLGYFNGNGKTLFHAGLMVHTIPCLAFAHASR